MSRFEKAKKDLFLWRERRDMLFKGLELTPEIQSVIRAVDAAFKSEVLECRIRNAVNSQVLNESDISNIPPYDTPTGKHHWDIDWWLTEATLRALHAGIDALAQLLNVVFKLEINRDIDNLPKKVAKKIKSQDNLSTAVKKMWCSPECTKISAFVNHVKHAGFPERRAQDVQHGLSRATSIEQFSYRSEIYGPWGASDIETIIDGFRQHALSVIDEACRADRKTGVCQERGY